MWMALDAVKKGEADVAISAGNTGALMAMSKICLRTQFPDPIVPAIAAILADAARQIDRARRHDSARSALTRSISSILAIMGSAMARIIFDIERPTVGLLNVGVEEIKGLEEVKAAGRALREASFPHLDYRGFVEGGDIGKGTVDVVVTEGFTGNIALKTAEGTARQISQYIRDAMARTAFLRGSAIFSRAARSTPCARSSIRARSTAAFSSASTASSSRATAARAPKATPARSRSATKWSAMSFSARLAI